MSKVNPGKKSSTKSTTPIPASITNGGNVAATPASAAPKKKKKKEGGEDSDAAANVIVVPTPTPIANEPTEIAVPDAPKKKRKKGGEPNAEPKPDPKPEPVDDVTKDVDEVKATAEAESKPRNRKVALTRELFENEFLSFIDIFDRDITGGKPIGPKILKSYRKRGKELLVLFKRLAKQKVKRVKSEVHKNNSGFQKPVAITDEMANFIGVSIGTLIPRREVTKALCGYVKSNQLQDKDDRRIILPDEPLSRLLKYDAATDDVLTIARLQKYMKNHFIK